MATATRRKESVRIRGTPPNLFAALRLTTSQARAISVSLDAPDAVVQKALESAPPLVQVSALNDAGMSRLHLRLPRTIPPGTYPGTIEIDEQAQDLVVEVEPRKRISIYPKRATITGKAGGRTELHLTLINMGNVPLLVPKASGFGLFQKKGLDLAVGRTFQKKPARGERSVDRFMDALSDGYGGVVKLKVQDGAGTLVPGDSRDVTVVFQIPSRLIANETYWGLWSIHDYNYKIEIDVLPDDTKKRIEEKVT